MRIMVITVDGKIMQSNVVVQKEKVSTVVKKLTSLWWVREAYPTN